MKTLHRTFAATLFLMISVALCVPVVEAEDTTSEKIVATVNGTKITQAEIDADIQQKLSGAAGKMPPEQLAQIKTRMQEKAVDNFITRIVLGMECDKKNITATPQEIDAALDQMRKSLPNGMTLDEALKAGGISLESIKQDITFGLRVNKLIEANIQQPAPPTEADLKDFYEQNKKSFEVQESVQARHILVKSPKDEDVKIKAEKKARAEDLRKQLIGGAAFEKIAAENSDCPSKKKGGALGTFGRGRMAKEFEDAAFSQKVGEIGQVVETRFGYHIIQVQEHKPASSKTFDESKDQIKKHLEQKNKNMVVREYIDELKSKATITYAKE